MKIRRLPALLAVGATAGITVAALAATALAATSGTARPNTACVKAAGKYTGHVITSYDTTTGTWVKKSTDKTTTDDVESPTVPASHAGSFPVEGGFVGTYQFNTAHTFRY